MNVCCGGSEYCKLKIIWLCGEVVTTALRNRFVSILPWVRLMNLYSISECHDVAASDLSIDVTLDKRTYCPVGKVFSGIHAVIMDKDQNIVPTGFCGEVCISGPTLARGYLNRPDLNAERFIKTSMGYRIYKTGDLGYMLSDGNLEIIGRCDTSIRIRGYMVELKAIEMALLDIPEVNMACVLIVNEGTNTFLTAYIVLENDCHTTVLYLRTILKQKLPFYSIPSHFIFLDKIVIQSSTGKINKSALPKPKILKEGDILITDESLTPFGKDIAKILCEVLGINTIYGDDNFFDLGGHSLSAALAISRMNQELGANLSTHDLYTHPTVEELEKKLTNVDGESFSKLDLIKEVDKYANTKNIGLTKLHSFWKSYSMCKNMFNTEGIFLTGVTGFLGSFLLRELVHKTQATIYCLIRCNNGSQNAEERLKSVLHKLNLSANLLNDRVIPIEGDISLQYFGLMEADYLVLCYGVNHVIHAASYVNLVLPYSALYRANVIGTENIISFCLRKRVKALHYISTTDTFSSRTDKCLETFNMADHAEKLNHGYGQSKWVAEQLVISASNNNGLPIVISRCGNIGGPSSRTGWYWNPTDLILYIVQSVVYTRVAPDVNWQVELTPVDFVSKVIVNLSQNFVHCHGKAFHIVNDHEMNCRDVWNTLKEIGYKLEVLPYNDWMNRVKQTASHQPKLRPLLQLFNSILKDEDYLVNCNKYDRENLNTFLHVQNLLYPTLNKQLVRTYLLQLGDQGYIPNNVKLETSICPSIKNRVALVFGASSGIGYGIAKELVTVFEIVVVAARSINKLKELKKECANAKGQIFPLKIDVTDAYEVQYGVRYVENTFGPIDVLINSAGVMAVCKMENTQLDDWNAMVRVNCDGALNCVAAVLPGMVKEKRGHIIHISSDAGRKPFPGFTVYSGTKFFLEAFSSGMRRELSTYNIKVTSIQPGDVETGLHQKSTDLEAMKEYLFDIPYLSTKNVAEAVLFAIQQPSNCCINEILVEPLLGAI